MNYVEASRALAEEARPRLLEQRGRDGPRNYLLTTVTWRCRLPTLQQLQVARRRRLQLMFLEPEGALSGAKVAVEAVHGLRVVQQVLLHVSVVIDG